MVLNGDVFLWAALIKHHYMFIWRPDSAIWQKLNSELEKTNTLSRSHTSRRHARIYIFFKRYVDALTKVNRAYHRANTLSR